MVKIPLPQDEAGVPYLANPDSAGNLAVPTEQYILASSGLYVPNAVNQRQQQVLTTTPLMDNATYTLTPAIDSLAVPQDNMVSAHVFANQAGALYMDVSMDNANWNLVQASVAVSANVAETIPWQPPLDRYYRFRYVNGAVAQTVFRLSASAMSVASAQNVNANIVGSLPNDGLTPIAGDVAQLGHLYNGITWDKARSNSQGTILASAARTAQTNSAQQLNYNARGVTLYLNITAASGTGGLGVDLILVDPVSGNSVRINPTPTLKTTIGLSIYQYYPGIATGIIAQANLLALPRIWYAIVEAGDASSYTYSLGYAYIL